MSTLTVRWYAQLREIRGADEEQVPFQVGDDIAQIYAALMASVPKDQRPKVAFACNHQLCDGSYQPKQGDLLVFLPPLGGG